MNQNIEKPATYALCCGCWDIRISSRIKKHSVFNKLVVSLKFTVHDQFGVLAPQFLTEGTSFKHSSLFELNWEGVGGQNHHCCS